MTWKGREEQAEDYTGEDCSGYEGYAEQKPSPVEVMLDDDTQQFERQSQQGPPLPFQSNPQDDGFSIDDLFKDEGFFNE